VNVDDVVYHSQWVENLAPALESNWRAVSSLLEVGFRMSGRPIDRASTDRRIFACENLSPSGLTPGAMFACEHSFPGRGSRRAANNRPATSVHS
jgi:hypothetical protein